jgi:Arc/MetJ-type ribon-helix-helix transcriptional regulator
MRNTQELSITLPIEIAEALRAKVRSGAFASESEAIREAIRALSARDEAVDHWLRQEVGAAYDAIVEDPTRAVPADQVRARLAAEQSPDQDS